MDPADRVRQLDKEIEKANDEAREYRKAYMNEPDVQVAAKVKVCLESVERTLKELHDKRGEYSAQALAGGSPLSLADYLQQRYQVGTMDAFLVKTYELWYRRARPGKPGFHGRLPSDLRSPNKPFLRQVEGHDGILYEVDLGQQTELICRHELVRAAIFFYGKVQNNFLASGGDAAYVRSLCMMALVGSPGTGKTTALLELVHLMREHIQVQPEDAKTLIAEAVGPREEASRAAEESLQRLQRSILEGKELVSWIRLEQHSDLDKVEESLDVESVVALRILYGLLCYLDNLDDPPSPIGSYKDFLRGMDDRVRGKLRPGDVFSFLDKVADVDLQASRVVFVLLDEFNSVHSQFPSDRGSDGPRRSWAQKAVSALLRYNVEHSQRKKLLVLPIIATSRHTDATLASTGTPKAQVAPLPLNAPLLSDLLYFLQRFSKRVQLTLGNEGVPSEAPKDEEAAAVQLAAWVGGNFRLMAWLLLLMGGARSVSERDGWKAEELAAWLSKDCKQRLPLQDSVCSILQELHGGMQAAGWFNKLAAPKNDNIKLSILEQAVAHALTGEPVEMAEEVLPGKEHKWGDLINEGLIHPVFLTEEQRHRRAHVLMEQSPVRAPTVERMYSASTAWQNPRLYGPVSPASDQGSAAQVAAGPSSPGSGQPPLAAPLIPTDDDMAGPSTPATGPKPGGSSGASTGSPDLQVRTALGIRTVLSSYSDLGSVPVAIELAPAVMTGLWRKMGLHGRLDMSPLAAIVYQEHCEKKEVVDLTAVLYPLLLRKRYLKKTWCRFSETVRAIWLPPWVAALRVELPDARVLENVACFDGQLTPEHYRAVRDAAHVALGCKEGADAYQIVEKAAKDAGLDVPGVAVFGSSNYGADAFLFTKVCRGGVVGWEQPEPLDIIIQSKSTEGEDTQTLHYAMGEQKKDLMRHGITCGTPPTWIEGLFGPPGRTSAKSQRLLADVRRPMLAANGGFPGGSMKDFEEAVVKADMPSLKAWEEQLSKRPISIPEVPTKFLYLFVTDHRMLPEQHARLRVLSLAGHPYVSRMVFIDAAQRQTFYGTATALQRSLAKFHRLGR
ncbi:hypothetical protein COCOBI_11-0100 [Coccomyxa sp. Obi]|nr:hypothetical protein COCOBI_11-0100 [Coccomyxa sp. Obi]